MPQKLMSRRGRNVHASCSVRFPQDSRAALKIHHPSLAQDKSPEYPHGIHLPMMQARASSLRQRNASLSAAAALAMTAPHLSFIACSLRAAPGEPCLDYIMIVRFMHAQQRNPSRDTSGMCALRPPSRFCDSLRIEQERKLCSELLLEKAEEREIRGEIRAAEWPAWPPTNATQLGPVTLGLTAGTLRLTR